MSGRSTRNKIRYHAQQAIERLDSVLESLKKVDDLSEGRSDFINEMLPWLVSAHESFKKAIVRFRDGL